ncbi:Hypp5277 [Branchiostoma lanceolatum]|uniref:Hypp5277 protein n=1 Tax=Branchiostoma lanceolatum TaxID=7740 RepID=A0A8K0AJ64_BRALA|nr:Hypp5277 [Branchiostoma lanceolatum]
MYFEIDFETLLPIFSVVGGCVFTALAVLAAYRYTVAKGDQNTEAVVALQHRPVNEGTTPPGFGQRTDNLSGGDGRVEWEIGEEDDKRTDGGSEGETEEDEEMVCPDEVSSAEDSMPELEDIAEADPNISLSEQKKDAADDSATAHGNENGEENAAEGEEEEKKEEKKDDEEKVNDDCEGTKEQQEEACPDIVKEETTPQEQCDIVQIATEIQPDAEKNGEPGKEKEQKRAEASAPEPVVAKKTAGDATTKVLKKKKKKKTRSQPPSLFSCPFMTSDMMEPSESRGPWRRRERGKPRNVYGFLADGKSKEEQKEDTVTEATQNGEGPDTNGGNPEAAENATTPVPDNDDDVKKVKEEIYEEAIPQRKVYKEAERCMTEEDRETERRIQQEQLAAIFKLMQDNEDKFGVQSYDDVEEQMKLYTS